MEFSKWAGWLIASTATSRKAFQLCQQGAPAPRFPAGSGPPEAEAGTSCLVSAHSQPRQHLEGTRENGGEGPARPRSHAGVAREPAEAGRAGDNGLSCLMLLLGMETLNIPHLTV